MNTADKQLLALARKHTRKDPQGISVLSLPSDRPEHTYYDLSVSNRKVLSPAGRRFLSFSRREELSKAEEILKPLPPEKFLQDLSAEEIERYLSGP